MPPRPTKRLALLALLLLTLFALIPASTNASRSIPEVFVDTDIGADDAIAIAWLLEQRNVKLAGFSTVQGNTTVENATRNLLTLFAAARKNYPVTIGAAQPLTGNRIRTGALVHGPDGLWFQQQPVNISNLPTDAPAAIAAQARKNPGTVFIALGPLTNFAQAVQRFPADLAGVRLIALGGGTRGNVTPDAEFNIYDDPSALEIVLGSTMKVELVTLDAFDQVRVDPKRFARDLQRRKDALGTLLLNVFNAYTQALTLGGEPDVGIPDAAAVIYALHPEITDPTSALVMVDTSDGLMRGATAIGTPWTACRTDCWPGRAGRPRRSGVQSSLASTSRPSSGQFSPASLITP
jgi:Inosine-uridine nucleoside N-ribohydrolase